jgi:hypothetical protein
MDLDDLKAEAPLLTDADVSRLRGAVSQRRRSRARRRWTFVSSGALLLAAAGGLLISAPEDERTVRTADGPPPAQEVGGFLCGERVPLADDQGLRTRLTMEDASTEAMSSSGSFSGQLTIENMTDQTIGIGQPQETAAYRFDGDRIVSTMGGRGLIESISMARSVEPGEVETIEVRWALYDCSDGSAPTGDEDVSDVRAVFLARIGDAAGSPFASRTMEQA